MSEPEPIKELREELGKNRDLRELLLRYLKQVRRTGISDSYSSGKVEQGSMISRWSGFSCHEYT